MTSIAFIGVGQMGGGMALKEAPAENTATRKDDAPKDPLGFLPLDGAAKQAAPPRGDCC